MSFDFSAHREALLKAILPTYDPNLQVTFPPAAAQCASAVMKDPTLQSQLDQSINDNATNIFSLIQILTAPAFGMPKNSIPQADIAVVSLNASLASFLLYIISVHLQTMSAFVTMINQQITSQPQSPDVINSLIIPLVKLLHTTNLYLAVVDSLSTTFSAVVSLPSASQQTSQLLNSISQIVTLASTIQSARAQGRQTPQEDYAFQQSISAILNGIPAYATFFQQARGNITASFQSPFDASKVGGICPQILSMSESASVASLIAIDVMMLDPNQFPIIAPALIEMLTSTFTITSEIVKLLRARTPLNQAIESINGAQQLLTDLNPAISGLILQILQYSVPPYQLMSQVFTVTFEQFSSIIQNLPEQIKILAEALKANHILYGEELTKVESKSEVKPIIKPVAKPAEPLTKPIEPISRTTQPIAKPVEPLAKPIEPIAKPVEPIAKPVEPIAKPVEPIVKPVEPIAKPAEPIVKPVEPIVKPAEPIAKPVEPIVKPVEPIAKPVEPIAKPIEKPAEIISKSVEPLVKPVEKSAISEESVNIEARPEESEDLLASLIAQADEISKSDGITNVISPHNEAIDNTKNSITTQPKVENKPERNAEPIQSSSPKVDIHSEDLSMLKEESKKIETPKEIPHVEPPHIETTKQETPKIDSTQNEPITELKKDTHIAAPPKKESVKVQSSGSQTLIDESSKEEESLKLNSEAGIIQTINIQSFTDLLPEKAAPLIRLLTSIYDTIVQSGVQSVLARIPEMTPLNSEFTEAMNSTLTSDNPIESKIKLSLIWDRFLISMSEFVGCLSQPQSSSIATLKTANLCHYLCLTLCSIGMSEASIEAEARIFKSAAKTVRTFYTTNFGYLLSLIQRLDSESYSLDADQLAKPNKILSAIFLLHRDICSYLKKFCADDSFESFSLAALASDRILAILRAYRQSLESAKLPENFQTILTSLGDYVDCYRSSLFNARKAIQLMLIQSADLYSKIMISIITYISNAVPIESQLATAALSVATLLGSIQTAVDDKNLHIYCNSISISKLFSAVKDVIEPSEILLRKCTKVVFGHEFDTEVHKAIVVFHILKYSAQLEEAIEGDFTPDNPPYIGLMMDSALDSIVSCIDDLINNPDTGKVTIDKLGRALSDLSATLNYVSGSEETQEFLKQCEIDAEIAYEKTALGDTSEDTSVAPVLKQIIGKMGILQPVSKVLIAKISSYDPVKSHAPFQKKLKIEVAHSVEGLPEFPIKSGEISKENMAEEFKSLMKPAAERKIEKENFSTVAYDGRPVKPLLCLEEMKKGIDTIKAVSEQLKGSPGKMEYIEAVISQTKRLQESVSEVEKLFK